MVGSFKFIATTQRTDLGWGKAAVHPFHIVFALALTLVLGACGRSPSVDSSSSAVAAVKAPLGHAGRWITDAQGSVVMLHGFNMVAKETPYTLESVGFGDDDAAFLARNGFNVVRVGFMWEAVEPKAGEFNDAYLDSIARTVETLGRHGILSLVDFHDDNYSERIGGQGFPDWTVFDDGLPNLPVPYANPAGLRTWDNFWANVLAADGIGLHQHFITFWQRVAQRFKGNPNVLGYDLMNEPQPGTQAALCVNTVTCPFEATTLTSFYREVIPQIRVTDPKTLIWYEPNVLAGAGAKSDLGSTGDANAGLSFHDYCTLTALVPQLPDSLRNLPCPIIEKMVLDGAEAHSQSTGAALLLTEFGSTPNLDENIRMAAAADQYRVGWINWAYNNTGTTNFAGSPNLVEDTQKSPEGDNVNLPLLKALARPYPQLISGTPLSWSYEPTSQTFQLDYSTARVDGQGNFSADAKTVISIPEVQYPNGYSVTVNGGKCLSSPDARLLVVRAESEAGEVKVVVTPKE